MKPVVRSGRGFGYKGTLNGVLPPRVPSARNDPPYRSGLIGYRRERYSVSEPEAQARVRRRRSEYRHSLFAIRHSPLTRRPRSLPLGALIVIRHRASPRLLPFVAPSLRRCVASSLPWPRSLPLGALIVIRHRAPLRLLPFVATSLRRFVAALPRSLPLGAPMARPLPDPGAAVGSVVRPLPSRDARRSSGFSPVRHAGGSLGKPACATVIK